jgi:3-hydroxybutyryl-CoA dehydrogenase
MHFFNPVPVSRLVELVRGPATSDATVDRVRGWVGAIGKSEIVVADVPGFATSRLGVAIGLEAIRMLEEGVASAEDIDRGMVLGYGFPVGPLRLTDIVGLDVRLEIAEYLAPSLGARFDPPALLRSMVAQGRLGRKSGRGFYEWEGAPA